MLKFICLVIGVCLAERPAEPPVRTTATLEVVPGPLGYRMTLEMTTASGATYAVPLDIEQQSADYVRDCAFGELVQANWLVETSGLFGLQIHGVRAKEGKVDPV